MGRYLAHTKNIINDSSSSVSSNFDIDSLSARREAETLAYKVAMTLLGPQVGAFEIRHTGGRKNEDHVYEDSMADTEDQDEVEIRLRNERHLRFAWFHHPILHARLNRPSLNDNLDKKVIDPAEEMTLMMDSTGMLSHEEKEAKQWIALFTKNVLKNL